MSRCPCPDESAARYQSVGDGGSTSGSERVLIICDRTGLVTWDSDVLLGRAGTIPNPGVTESLWSGRISPNKRPAWRGEAGVVALGACVVADPAVRGLDILLANDCELLETWSPAAAFGRGVVRAPEVLPVSRPVSRVAVVLVVPCDVAPLPTPGDLPFTLLEAVSRVDVLGAVLRAAEGGCDADWSNFFLRSLTLGGTPPAVPPWPFPADGDGLPAPLPEFPDRLSTGFEAERWFGGRRALRWAACTAGCLGVVPFPLDRNDGGGCRVLLGTAGAAMMGSVTGGEAFPAVGDSWAVP